MLPSIPPNVVKYGSYSIAETCVHLGCCRDVLRQRTATGKIKSNRLDEDGETTIYYAKEILRYWFNATKQPKTEGELDVILDSIALKGYEATFGCKPPEIKKKSKGKKTDVA